MKFDNDLISASLAHYNRFIQTGGAAAHHNPRGLKGRVKLKPLKNLRPKGPSTFSCPPLSPLNQPAPSGPNLLNPGPLCGPFPLDSLNNSC